MLYDNLLNTIYTSEYLGGKMGFVKDGEIKVFKDKVVKTGKDRESSGVEKVRYTVDDLVRDTDGPEEEVDAGEDDASHQARHH